MTAADLPRPEGFDRWDPQTWPEYDDATHKATVLALADEMGESGDCQYEGRFDWERFTGKMEEYLSIILPTTWEHPIFAAIKRTARKAWKETNG